MSGRRARLARVFKLAPVRDAQANSRAISVAGRPATS